MTGKSESNTEKKEAEKTAAAVITGCVGLCWALLIEKPLWCAILYALMSSRDMPVWAWVVFWCYIPSVIVGLLITTAVKVTAYRNLK